MRKLLGSALVVAGMVMPGVAAAQMGHDMGGGRHELGVDLFAAYQKPSGGSGGLVMNTPVDVRIGFAGSGKMTPEFRVAFALATAGTTTYTIQPGLNLLFQMGEGTRQHNTYFTVGADIAIVDAGPVSGTVPSINGGIGMRRPYESGATRYELFARYRLKSTKLGRPNTLQIGARLGLSLWH